MRTRALVILLVASLALNGFTLLKVRSLEHDVDVARAQTVPPSTWITLSQENDVLEDRVRALESAAGLVSGSAFTTDTAHASCGDVPTRFEASFHRVPAHATARLAYWPTWDLLAEHPEVTNGTVTTVNATLDTTNLRATANASLSDALNYAYRWVLEFPNGSLASRTLDARVAWELASVPRESNVRYAHADGELVVHGSPDTRACTRVEGGFVILHPESTEREARSFELTRSSPFNVWRALVDEDAYANARSIELEWFLEDGRVLRQPARVEPAPTPAPTTAPAPS